MVSKSYKMLVKLSIFFLVIIVCFSQISALLFFPYPQVKLEAKSNQSSGEPLILTPYLKKGDIDEAQKLSKVPITDDMGFTSYSGFFTVDEKYNSNLFFWYFPPISQNPHAPVLLWLQGGPGGTSLFGLFTENGPLVATKRGFARRKYHWALDNHLIYIDNPVGTGFSYTKDELGYCRNETCIAKGLYSALQQFFTLFPHLRERKFYISGESYAGKYIPALGIEIHHQNYIRNEEIINLKGMAIGNGYCDPVNQIDYGNYLYQHGLIDDNELKLFLEMQNQIATYIKDQNWAAAGILMDKLMDGDLNGSSYFKNYTGFDYYYNFLHSKDNTDMSIFAELINNDTVRRNIHVGGLPFNDGKKVALYLMSDLLQSVAPYITQLLSHYQILFYNGQLDIIVAYPLTENFLRHLDFDSSEQYKTAERKFWMVDGEVAGYVKKAGNLTEVLVRDSGHMVPHDQPKWALDLISKFIKNKL